MLTFATYPLLTENSDGELSERLDNFMPLSDLNLWGWPRQNYWTFLTDAPDDTSLNVGLPRMNWPPRWRLRLNSLYWPTGATRWAQFIGLCDGNTLQKILAKVEPPPSNPNQQNPPKQNLAQQLVIGDNSYDLSKNTWPPPSNAFTSDQNGWTVLSTKMYLLQPRAISLGSQDPIGGTGSDALWLLPLVDERYFWQWAQADIAALINAQPSLPSSWTANTAYPAKLTIDASGFVFSSSGGTSGGAAPTWPNMVGSTVNDNSITWTCLQVPPSLPGPVTATWWSQVLALLGTQTDSRTINLSAINSNYATSDPSYQAQSLSQWQKPGIFSMMLDAAALNCGLRIVRGINGIVSAISASDSWTKYELNITPPTGASGRIIMGGDVSSVHRSGSQPEAVNLVFSPHPDASVTSTIAGVVSGNPPTSAFQLNGSVQGRFTEGQSFQVTQSTGNNGTYHVSQDATFNSNTNQTTIFTVESIPSGAVSGNIVSGIPIESIAVSDSSVLTQSQNASTVGEKRILTTAKPIDAPTALAFGQAVTQDYYSWRQAAFDYVFAGISSWDPTGFDDAMEFRVDWDRRIRNPSTGGFGFYTFHTRVQSLPPSCESGQLVIDNEPELQYLVAGFPQMTAPIVGLAGGVQIQGNFVSIFATGYPLQIINSNGNDGLYRAAAGASFANGITTVPVNVALPSSTANGTLAWPLPNLAIVNSTVSPPTLIISGNYAAYFPQGGSIEVARTGPNDGIYTISSPATYNSSTQQTSIPISPQINIVLTSGYLRNHYPAPHESPLSFPACSAGFLNLGQPPGSAAPIFAAKLPQTNILSLEQYIPQGSLVRVKRQNGIYQPLGISLNSFIYAGGGSGNGTPPHSHARLDPGTGRILWTQDRGVQLNAMAIDQADGSVYTAGLGGIEKIEIPIVQAVFGQSGNGYFVFNGNLEAILLEVGFIDVTQIGSGNNGLQFVISKTQVEANQTIAFSPDNVFGGVGGTASFPFGAAGHTLEKWTSGGSPIWQADLGPLTAVTVDSQGYVYVGTISGTVIKLDVNGNVLANPFISLPAPFAGTPVNSISVDPIDGRIAVGFGVLETGPPIFGNLSTMGQFDILFFTAAGTLISGLPWMGNPLGSVGNVAPFAASQACCRFDWNGNLYSVGVNAYAVNASIIGWAFDYNSKLINFISWGGQNSPNMGLSIATGLNRILIGGIASPILFNGSPNAYVSPYTVGALAKPNPTTTPNWLWKIIVEQFCVGIAADRGGNIYAACFTGSSDALTPAQVYGFDPEGNSKWTNGLWISGISYLGLIGTPRGGPPPPLLVAAY